MERHILWSPEPGHCDLCGCKSSQVRRFTTHNTHEVYCFPCWNGNQDPCVVSSGDWADDETVIFRIGPPDSGASQRAAMH